MQAIKRLLRTIIPGPVFSVYHFTLAWLAALLYGFPSREITVVGVTGTKGKSSTIEFLNSIFEEAGYTTAVLNSIRIKIGNVSNPNDIGRSMPGRFTMQRFLNRAIHRGCTVAIIEMTSEGARQHRHRFINLDALVFTNLAPEHIESHGSLQAYADAKFEFGKQLARSKKRPRYMVANADDAESARFLTLSVEQKIGFSLKDGFWKSDERGGQFSFENTDMHINLPGKFSLMNALAAASLARWMNIKTPMIARGLLRLHMIPGRAERVDAGQDFLVIVDYAHTPDSLQALMDAYGTRHKICILGSAGGGRDIWKRPLMGQIAEKNCAHVILTNDDPYDEDPRSIVEGIARGMVQDTHEIILDRREAIRRGLRIAKPGDAVLITGKGIDPIYGREGKKIPWSDAAVAREELDALQKNAASAVV